MRTAGARLQGEGIPVVLLEPDAEGRISSEQLAEALREHPEVGLVSLAAANHELGNAYDIPAFVSATRESAPHCLVHCDAVQAFGKLPIDFSDWDLDLMSLSSHKVYGPKGAGALVHRRHLEIGSLLHGGQQERGRRPGTESVLTLHGFGVAASLIAVGLNERRDRMAGLRARLLDGLAAIPGVRVNGAGGRGAVQRKYRQRELRRLRRRDVADELGSRRNRGLDWRGLFGRHVGAISGAVGSGAKPRRSSFGTAFFLGPRSRGERHRSPLVGASRDREARARARDGRGSVRVVCAMSGGVDSSLAAALMVEAGHEVIGMTMSLYDASKAERKGRGGTCCSPSEIDLAQRVCQKLGIPHYTVNERERFESAVIDDFVREYAAGRTPNPCARCNEHVKFAPLLERAEALGAEFMVTGHYARIEDGALLRGIDPAKDQSYFLFAMGREALSRVRFPLGGWSKEKVRERAKELEMPNWSAPDSQELCFVPGGDHGEVVEKRARALGIDPEILKPGEIRDEDGTVLGEHRGIHRVTIGQRRGLGSRGGGLVTY